MRHIPVLTQILLPEIAAIGGIEAFENKLNYAGFVESPDHGATAWLLSSAPSSTLNLARMMLVIPFVVEGAHQYQTHTQSAVWCDQVQHLLSQVQPSHKLRFEYRVQPTLACPVDVRSQPHAVRDDVATYLAEEAQYHNRRLMTAGRSNQVTIFGFLRLPMIDTAKVNHGKLEQAMAQLKQWTQQMFVAASNDRLEQVLRKGFDIAVQYQSLWQASKLNTRFMTTEESLMHLATCLGSDRITAPPQRLILLTTGLEEHICDNPQDPRSPLFYLMKGGAIEPHPGHVTIKSRGKPPRHIAVMRVESLPRLLPPAQGLMCFIPDLLAKAQLSGLRFIVEYSALNADMVDVLTQKQIRQSKIALAEADTADIINPKAEDNLAQSADLLHETATHGGCCLQFGALIVVERSSFQALETACLRLEQVLEAFFRVVREQHVADRLWLQTLPLKAATLMRLNHADFRLKYLVKDAIALFPVARPCEADESGVIYHTQAFGQPIRLDFFNENRQLLMMGTTRSGKTVTLVNIAATGLRLGKSVVILDYVRSGGAGTFDRFTELMSGSYIDPITCGLDILAFPYLGHLTNPETQRTRLESCKETIKAIVRFHLLGRAPAEMTRQDRLERQVLDILIEAYWVHTGAEDLALAAYKPDTTAVSEGFFAFCQVENIAAYDLGAEAELALTRIRAAYLAEEHSAFGQVLFRSSTLDVNAKLQTFPIKDGEGDEAAKAAMVVAYVAQRQAFAAEEGALLLCDEASVLLRDSAVAHVVGRFYALGLGMDLHCGIASQDPDVVVNSPVAAQILANCNTILIGRTQEAALATFIKDLAIPPEMIRPTLGYQVNTQTLSSEWLLVDSLSGQRQYTPCRFYCHPALLAITASNPAQNRARQRLMTAFPGEPLAGLKILADKLVHALQTDQSIEMLVDAYLAEHCV